MNSEELLPQTVLSKASIRGKEYAWQKDDVKEAILAARQQNLATLGGEVQFRIPNGTCELYWLSFDPADKSDSEIWQDYVARSASECMTNIDRLRNTTDFEKLGKENFRVLHNIAETEDIGIYLCFVLYFVTEEEYKELKHLAKNQSTGEPANSTNSYSTITLFRRCL